MERITYSNDGLLLGEFTPNENYKLMGKYKGLYLWVDVNDGKFLEIEVCLNRKHSNSRDPLGTKKKSYDRVMTLDLVQSRSRVFKKPFEVSMVIIDGRYQGFGLAAKVYRYLIKKTGLTLQAGRCQSIGGRSIWNELAKYKDVQVVGKKDSSGLIDMEAGEDREISTGITGVNCYDSGKFTAYAYYKGL